MNIEQLSQHFNSAQLSEDAMEFIEMHGFLTSLAIVPGHFSEADILKEIFSTEQANKELSSAITALTSDIAQALLNGQFPQLPETLSIEEDEELDLLSLWACGFMQGIFLQDKQWFGEHADEVGELTLPILSCSGLLDEDDESNLQEITENEDILDAMIEKIPDCVVDLYLLFNAPADA